MVRVDFLCLRLAYGVCLLLKVCLAKENDQKSCNLQIFFPSQTASFSGIRFSGSNYGVLVQYSVNGGLNTPPPPHESPLLVRFDFTMYINSAMANGKIGLTISTCLHRLSALETLGEARAKQYRGFGALLFQSSLCFNKALVSLVLRHEMPLTSLSG